MRSGRRYLGVPAPGDYEASQIDALLRLEPRKIELGAALVMLPVSASFDDLYHIAIAPALAMNGLNRVEVRGVFDHRSPLEEVCAAVQTAELIVADVTYLNPAIMYVLGLAHGVGRSPILMAREFGDLPFNLGALRCIEYTPRGWGLVKLRERLMRAVRIFLAGSRS